MAKMIPSNLELTNATLSERKVFNALKTQLRSDVFVFYSVSWQTIGSDGKRKQSECDFLIVDPKYGFLTCEVKGGIKLEVTEDREWRVWDSEHEYHVLTRSPQQQAEENSRYFKSLYEDFYKMSYEGIFGSFTIFPNYLLEDGPLLDNNPKTIVLDKLDMMTLSEKIDSIFKYFKGKRKIFFTSEQSYKLIGLINDRKAVNAAAGELIEYKEKEFEVINRVQDGYIYFIKEHNQVLISGGAGTGKTWIGMKLAVQKAKESKSVLFICYSDSLALYIKNELEENFKCKEVTVLSYRKLIEKDKRRLDLIDYPYKLCDEYSIEDYEKYDSIIVDEAQDFDKYEAMILRLHLKSDLLSDFYVFYDKTQNLYNKDFEEGFMIKEKSFYLHENLRNTASIYNFACEKTNLGTDVIANQIIGSKPVKQSFNSLYDLNEYVENVLNRLVNNEFIPLKYISIIVCDDLLANYENMGISRWNISSKYKGENIIKLSSIGNYKGMESNIVIYIHTENTTKEYDYVAYTRAKYFLYDFILKNKIF